MAALPFKSRDEYGKEIIDLGEGTYGRVMMTDKYFAVKTIKPDEDDIIDQATIIDQTTLQEIVFLNKISSPYVIPLIDVIMTPYEQKLILPLADNTLSRLMGSATLDVKSLVRQLCLGVAHLHNADLLHLDLKPDNLLIYGTKEGYMKSKLWIADLGISRIHTCALPPVRNTFFSKWYRPFEIFLHEPVTDKCDIWALGVIIAELLISQRLRQRTFLFSGKSEYQIIHTILETMGSPPLTSRLRSNQLWKDNMGIYENKFRDKMRKKFGLTDVDLDFLEFILRLDPDERPDIWEILQHPWLELDKDNIPLKLTCDQRLLRYAQYPNYAWEKVEDRNIFVSFLIRLTGFVGSTDLSLGLSIYLFDRLIALCGNLKGLRAHTVAVHYLATTFYGETSYIEYIPILSQLELTTQLVLEAIDNVLRKTCFDLATVTSYFFLSRYFRDEEEKLKRSRLTFATAIWRSSLYTMAHFDNPSLVADAIIAIVNKDYRTNNLAIKLLDEIMSLPEDLPLEYGRYYIKVGVKHVKERIREFLTTD